MSMQRTFALDEWSMRGDGRTVEGRILPFHEVATITERDKESGQLVTFDEQFLPGCCAAMVQAYEKRGNAAFIKFRIEHEDVFDQWIGYAASIREEPDGAYATFRLYESKDIEKTRSILAESHTGLSVNFGAIRTPKRIREVVSHTQIGVEHVAATPVPCYAGAAIVGMRGDDESTDGLVIATPHLDAINAMLAELREVPTP